MSESNALDHLWDCQSNILIGMRVVLAFVVLRFLRWFGFSSKRGKVTAFSVLSVVSRVFKKGEMEGVFPQNP